LALGLALPLATAGTSVAAPKAVPAHNSSLSPASATACWPEGTRLKKTTEGRVYLIGPRNWLYWITDQDTYNALWGSWDGILTVPDAAFDACYHEGSRPLRGARLIKTSNNPAVYIYDSTLISWRHIVDWNTFTNKYHFDPAKIKLGNPAYVNDQMPWT
jgi:hypothetical protein